MIGLTTAIVLAERYAVTIVAERFGAATDSVKATAIWHVYLVPETPTVLRWAAKTLDRLIEIAENSPAAGVEIVQGVELFRTRPREIPSWAHIPRVFVLLGDAEVGRYNVPRPGLSDAERDILVRHPVTWGYRIAAPAAKMETYLSWLVNTATAAGIELVQRKIDSLKELGSYDAIVNCSGIGARELVGDDAFVPFKGQYFVLAGDDQAPTEYVGDDDFPSGMAYVIARGGEILVGGTAEEGKDDLIHTLLWEDVAKRAGTYVPWVLHTSRNHSPRRLVVGVRPCRPAGICLERADHIAPNTIHNYGHGGSGFSLSWGCAFEVATLLAETLA